MRRAPQPPAALLPPAGRQARTAPAAPPALPGRHPGGRGARRGGRPRPGRSGPLCGCGCGGGGVGRRPCLGPLACLHHAACHAAEAPSSCGAPFSLPPTPSSRPGSTPPPPRPAPAPPPPRPLIWSACCCAPGPPEGRSFAAAAALDTHRALVHVFFAQRSTKRVRGVTDGGLKPRPINKVRVRACVGGCGLGAGLAACAALLPA
jgi:hypothetical protein